MRDLWIVAKYTAKEMIKRKSFLISTLLILLLIVVGFNIPNIMGAFKGNNVNETKENIMIVDPQNVYEGTLGAFNEMDLGYQFEIVNEELSMNTIKEKIEKDEIEAAIVISKNQNGVTANYITDSLGFSGVSSELGIAFEEQYKNLQIQKAGLSAEQMANINTPINLTTTEMKEGSSGTMLVIAMILCILLFYAIYFCAYQVSSSITTEKTSKIMETLVTSTKPSNIVIGKTLGIGLVGLLQVGAIVLTAFVSYQLFMPKGMLEGIFDVSKITPMFVIVTFIYFILGYILYAFLYALTGSTVSKPEDINSANSPIAILAVISFYLAYFSMMNPMSSINSFAGMFPFSSPFSMPFKIIGGTAGIGEVLLSLAILIVTIFVIARIAIRIYSSAILHYGSKLSLKDILTMYKDKNN